MLGWLRSLVLTRPAGEPRAANARPRPALSLERLDDRSVPSAAPAVGLQQQLADALLARVAPDGSPGSGPTAAQTGPAVRVELRRALLDHLAGAAGLPPGVVVQVADDLREAAAPVLASAFGMTGPGLFASRMPLDPETVGLLLDQLRRDPEVVVLDWLAVAAEKRAGPAHLPAPEDDLSGSGDEAALRGRTHPPLVIPETPPGMPTLAAKAIGLSAAGQRPEAGYSVWVGLRDAPAPNSAPVSPGGGAMPAATPGSPPSAPRPLPDGPADSTAQLLPEAADFLCPVVPFDAAVLRDQVARFRDLLEPVVPVIEPGFVPDEWWVGAAVGAGVGAVVWSRRSASRTRGSEQPGAGRSARPDETPEASPAWPPRPHLEVAEVGGEGVLAAWGAGRSK